MMQLLMILCFINLNFRCTTGHALQQVCSADSNVQLWEYYTHSAWQPTPAEKRSSLPIQSIQQGFTPTACIFDQTQTTAATHFSSASRPQPIPAATTHACPALHNQQMLTKEQKELFIRDGYLILPSIVPEDKVSACEHFIDAAFAAGNYTLNDYNKWDVVPRFDANVQADPLVHTLLGETRLHEACEDLLGKGHVRYGGKAQVAFRPQDKRKIEAGMSMTQPMWGKAWHIDGGKGKYAKVASPFTLLVGVCISKGQHVDENRGQLNVWPGSHSTLHPLVCDRVSKNLVPEDGHNVFGGAENKPNLGPSTRVLLRPGDAVIAHQRLGHSGGINLHDATRKNLYFRVSHKNHDSFLEDILNGGSVWTEYEGIHNLTKGL